MFTGKQTNISKISNYSKNNDRIYSTVKYVTYILKIKLISRSTAEMYQIK